MPDQTDQNSQIFKAIPTQLGLAKIAAALSQEGEIVLTEMALGSMGHDPSPFETGLLEERYRGALSGLYRPPENPAYVVAEMLVPPEVGGWYIREIGLYDEAGDLFAIASCAEIYKPLLSQGQAAEVLIRVILEVSEAASVTIIINPSALLASKDEVAAAIAAHEKKNPAHPAKNISYQTKEGLSNVQAALDGLEALLQHLADGYFNFEAGDAGKYLTVGEGGEGLVLKSALPETIRISNTGNLSVISDLNHLAVGSAGRITAYGLSLESGGTAVVRLRFVDWISNAWQTAASAQSVTLTGGAPVEKFDLADISLSRNGKIIVDITSVTGVCKHLSGWLTLEPGEEEV